MELETRYHAYMENRNSLRKAEILRKRLNGDLPLLPDELDRELMQIDMEKMIMILVFGKTQTI